MALSQRLDLRQSQSLVMTPQLQQAIKLLQFSSNELREFVESELQQNPMLERDESSDDNRETEDRTLEDTAASNHASTIPEIPDDGAPPDSMEHVTGDATSSVGESPLDIDHSAVWEGDGPNDSPESSSDTNGLDQNIGLDRFSSGAGGRADFTATENNLEATLSETKTLRDHLTEQLQVDITDAKDRLIGRYLIESLDQSGWISNPLEEIAEMLGCPKERVEKILLVLQRFDPPGVFARDLRECLALQLQDRNRFDPAMATLLENLDLLAKQDKSGLINICDVDEEDLTEMVAEIRALNPKPAQCFEQEILQTVTPDIFMRPHPDGGWIVELNSETLPRVLVNTEYYTRIAKEVRNKNEKDYISEHFQSANWLVKSLHQRATTILKVAREIVLQQHSFFSYGVEHLKPLILRNIAEAIEMHESTVSRVTSNKYIHTPRGTFELKYFFTSAIGGTGGAQSHSAESVRHRIKSLIDQESPNAILSDDGIVAILKGDGVDIARRTVAKYREALKIPSSVQRRRYKNKQL